MARRKSGWRPTEPKVLSTPASLRRELCYGSEGKGLHHTPLPGERVELLLIDEARRTRWVTSGPDSSKLYPVDGDVTGLRVLGWRLPDGALRHGDYDAVDPELADFAKLPRPNTEIEFGLST
jgi:hypothetical protein